MKFISTRGAEGDIHTKKAILHGIAPDGGLFVPVELPAFDEEDLVRMSKTDYKGIACHVLSKLLDDFSPEDIKNFINEAYSEEKFDENPAPLVQLNKYNDKEYILELWHGPTSAFKDIALQLLPRLMTASARELSPGKKIRILTATSGDTGKAALEGFRDVDGIDIVVFYPSGGVSEAQKLQMVTQEGENCRVYGIRGSFDDAQRSVKDIFNDINQNKALEEEGIYLSSANSINWGRLAPQIVYYFSSYAGLMQTEKIEFGEKINFVVPTGNFGNILAGWYAMKMGLPVNKFICASNRNKILSDFLRTGNYDLRRKFYKTNSPSMDILVSSNLERLLFEVSGRDSSLVNQWMKDLKMKQYYSVPNNVRDKINEYFVGGYAEDGDTLKTIKEVYDKYDHCVDPHTAVGFNVYERYFARTGDDSKTVFVSTASPFKFPESVGNALWGKGYNRGRNREVLLRELSEEIGIEIPQSLVDLDKKEILHPQVIEISQIPQVVNEKTFRES